MNSIQTLHTEITVIEIFENLLEGLISIQQYEKIYPDPKLFIELLEFATQFYNNYTFNHSLS